MGFDLCLKFLYVSFYYVDVKLINNSSFKVNMYIHYMAYGITFDFFVLYFYVCMYYSVHVNIYIYIYACMYVHMDMYVCLHVYGHVCMHICIRMCLWIGICMSVDIYVWMCVSPGQCHHVYVFLYTSPPYLIRKVIYLPIQLSQDFPIFPFLRSG